MNIQTPSQTVGPFFHYGLVFGGEDTLVTDETRGERIIICGSVYDGDGELVPDAMIEIWQADANGYFNHPNDPNHGKADPHFSGFGRSDTTKHGTYRFLTIKPGIVSGQRVPYVNVRIFARGMLIHAVTRLYFADEAGNSQDAVLNSVDASRRQTLMAALEDSGNLPTYRFDIRIQGKGETVFFDA